MSLIYGIKTQIGAYLAADTRLTTILPSGILKTEDDFGKYHTFSKYLHVVAAGDANLASYLIQKIQSSDLRAMQYFEFRDKIKSFIEEEVGFFPYVFTAKNVVFIFAGCDMSKEEEVDMNKIVQYLEIMQGNSEKPVQQSLTKPLKEAMKKAAFANKKGNLLTLEGYHYTGLFSLEIKFNGDSFECFVTEAKWGEYLMYGPEGLTAKAAPPDLFIDIDIGSKPKDLKGQDLVYYNSLLLIEFFVVKMIPKYQLHTVGGSVITFWVTEHGIIFPTGEVARRQSDGSISRNLSNIYVKGGKISTKIGDNFKPLRELISFYKVESEISGADI